MINTILTAINRINRILLIIALVLAGVIAVVQVIKLAPQWLATLSQETSGPLCSAKSGYVLCGYCDEDVIFSGNPNAGKCRYCPKGTKCQGDICGELTCSGGGTTGTSGSSGTQPTNYYVLCWDCTGVRSVSYNGYDTTNCWYYWNLCDIYQCRNMRRKCW